MTSSTTERFEIAFRHGPVGVAIATADPARPGVIVEANHELNRLFGFDGDGLVGTSYRELTHPEDRPAAQALMAELLSGPRRSYQIEKRHVRRDGSVFWAVVHVALAEPGGEERPYLVVHLEDIDGRKQMEAELRRRREQLEYAQRVARLGTFEWWLEPDEGEWSDETYRIFGWEPRAFTPRYEHFHGRLHPDDRERAARALREAMEHPVIIEYRMVRIDGRHLMVRTTAEPLRDDRGRVVALRGTFQDVTDRRELERALLETERFQTMFDTAPIATFIVDLSDASYRISEANPAAAELTGMDLDALVSQPAGDVLQGGRLPREVVDVFERRRPEFHGHQQLAQLDGGGRQVELTAYTIEGRRPGSSYGVLHLRDRAAPRTSDDRDDAPLTDRERQILELSAAGHRGADIAVALHLSPETVKTHFRRIYAKLGVSDRAAAVAQALRRGLID